MLLLLESTRRGKNAREPLYTAKHRLSSNANSVRGSWAQFAKTGGQFQQSFLGHFGKKRFDVKLDAVRTKHVSMLTKRVGGTLLLDTKTAQRHDKPIPLRLNRSAQGWARKLPTLGARPLADGNPDGVDDCAMAHPTQSSGQRRNPGLTDGIRLGLVGS